MAQYLLDTNTCIALMRGQPNAIRRMAVVSPVDCAVSAITEYELFTGVEKCSNPAKERAKVELFLATVQVLPFESEAAKRSAIVRALLESQGKMIGPYDVLLAGQALADSQTMVTANTKEFSRVPGLTLENWEK